ncbi:MAG: AI-2E family transporter, partial [Rhizobiaceae bacterium]|nr:AI-2E family transporter [Rhizobiaceae bacterium]
RQAVRRLKRAKPSLRVGIYVPNVDEDRKIEAKEISADFVVDTVTEAVRQGLTEGDAVPLARATRLKPTRTRKAK